MVPALETIHELQDKRWVRQALFQRNKEPNASRKRDMEYTPAALKYYDTSLGGHPTMNPVPQISPLSDIRAPSMSSQSLGVGEYWSRTYDDDAQTISLQFGVPEHNSLSAVLSNFYDPDLGTLVATGKVSNGFLFTAAEVAGTLLTLPFQAYTTVSNFFTRVASTISGNPYTKFYYMKSTMGPYWNAVSIMLTKLAVEMRILPGINDNDGKGRTANDPNAKNTPTVDHLQYEVYKQLLPDIIKDSGSGIMLDAFAIATRCQRLSDSHNRKLSTIAETASSPEAYAAQVKAYLKSGVEPTSGITNLKDYMSAYADDNPDDTDAGAKASRDNQPNLKDTDKPATSPVDLNKFSDFLTAELRDGSAFVNFRVNHSGPVSESFSNTVKTVGIEEMMNSLSSANRDMKNNMGGGNIGDDILSNAVEGVVGGLKDIAGGLASSVGLGGLIGLGGGAQIKLTQVWDGSTAELPSSSYTMRLATPYGDKMAILMHVYAPLIMLLAGGLPRSTGATSHGAPFICRLHDKGRSIKKTAIIRDISISRGEGKVAFTKGDLPTAIDVTFTVQSLEQIMMMPISEGIISDALTFSAFGEDTAMSDYISSLSGIGLADTYYAGNRMKLAFAQTKAQFNTLLSPAHAAQYMGGTFPGRIMSMLAKSGALPN